MKEEKITTFRFKNERWCNRHLPPVPLVGDPSHSPRPPPQQLSRLHPSLQEEHLHLLGPVLHKSCSFSCLCWGKVFSKYPQIFTVQIHQTLFFLVYAGVSSRTLTVQVHQTLVFGFTLGYVLYYIPSSTHCTNPLDTKQVSDQELTI